MRVACLINFPMLDMVLRNVGKTLGPPPGPGKQDFRGQRQAGPPSGILEQETDPASRTQRRMPT